MRRLLVGASVAALLAHAQRVSLKEVRAEIKTMLYGEKVKKPASRYRDLEYKHKKKRF